MAANVQALLKKLAALGDKDDKLDEGLSLLSQLKVALLAFDALPPSTPPTPSAAQLEELRLAREVFEAGAFLSIRATDIPSFERHVAQLKVYYTDCAGLLPQSPKQLPILGLNLLRLLAQNRIAEFHTELELVPAELQSDAHIRYSAQLEEHIMEGSYNKVLAAKQGGLFAREGMYFMDLLVETVRDEIADCSEKAYASIASAELRALLMLGSDAELGEYADARVWAVGADGVVAFGGGDAKPLLLPSKELIQETLSYAKELERIV